MINELIPLLQRLDKLLCEAVTAAQVAYGTETATDPYRGLHINQPEVEQLLSRQPATPVFEMERESPIDLVGDDSALFWLQQTFELSAFDLDVIIIALAPELDRRYERLYAYLQDDVRCKRPSVDLALNLLCSSAAVKLAQRNHFGSHAPLIRHGLVHLTSDPNSKSTLLAQELHLDNQVVRFLLGEAGLDRRLVSWCQLIQPKLTLQELLIDDEIKQPLSTLVIQDWQSQQPLYLYFQGSERVSKRCTAEALAQKIQAPLLVVDLAKIIDTKADFEPTIRLILREAWFQNALLYIDNLDVLLLKEQAIAYESLLAACSENQNIIILAGIQPWVPTVDAAMGIITVPFKMPDFAQRRSCWQNHLNDFGIALPERELNDLVDRFRLAPHQIADAVTSAFNLTRWQTVTQSHSLPTQNNATLLYAAARAQSGHDLGTLARKIEPKYNMGDIVLPAEQQQQLKEICNQAKYRHIVYGQWGFGSKQSLGKGLNVLFTGSPGTGKTMAAEIIADELQLDLYKIDLSQIVSKYVGETEKNLSRIFTAAENANAILFFDEADAIFGKRSEVKDAHDRYANLEIAYLLQKMEEYEGVTILTSNFRQNLDDAFTRRIRFIVEFPFPEQEYRLQIWQGVVPAKMPLDKDVNLELMAKQFKLAGGSIRNVVLAAAFLAAENNQSVGMKHILLATKRELQKMGRLINDEEFEKLAIEATQLLTQN